MDGGRHFCTHPDSLPPHSISRQSIKSSGRKEKQWKKKGRKRSNCNLEGVVLLLLLLISVLLATSQRYEDLLYMQVNPARQGYGGLL